jgi:hypothetical protein
VLGSLPFAIFGLSLTAWGYMVVPWRTYATGRRTTMTTRTTIMCHARRRAGFGYAVRQGIDQGEARIGRLQQNGAAIRARVLLIEPGHERAIEQVQKENSLWCRVVAQRRRLDGGQARVATALCHVEAFLCTRNQQLS